MIIIIWCVGVGVDDDDEEEDDNNMGGGGTHLERPAALRDGGGLLLPRQHDLPVPFSQLIDRSRQSLIVHHNDSDNDNDNYNIGDVPAGPSAIQSIDRSMASVHCLHNNNNDDDEDDEDNNNNIGGDAPRAR